MTGFCLLCGQVFEDDLDALDVHVATCDGIRRTYARDVRCPECGAAPGRPCRSRRGRPQYTEGHTDRWDLARKGMP